MVLQNAVRCKQKRINIHAMYQMLIISILITSLNFKSDRDFKVAYQEIPIEIIDTINYWHILIDNKVVLKANQNLKDSDLEIKIESNDFPNEVEFDFKTDHGFEHNVDRVIEIYSNQNLLLSQIESSTYEYGETTKIPIGKELNENEELILKCKFYISSERMKNEKTFYNQRMVNKYLDKEKAESFVICKLKK